MSQTKDSSAAPKHENTKPRPEHRNPAHEEKRIDDAVEDSFPASDPSAETQPKPTRKQK